MAPAIDHQVARVVDRKHVGSDDEDDLIAELEEDDNEAFSALREKRLEQLHAEMTKTKVLKESQHGTYQEIKDEKQLMDITTSTKLCVVHFMKPDFARCGIMNEALDTLAERHYEVRFVSINVENAPFLVVKLVIKVLPCVIAFRDGVSVDRIIGFESIGYREDRFTNQELERRLLTSGVLLRAKIENVHRVDRGKQPLKEDVWDEDEWD